MSLEPNKMELIEITNGPPFEHFLHESNIFISNKHRSVLFDVKGSSSMEVNICGLTRITPGGRFTFSGEYYAPIKVNEKNHHYVIGVYNTTTKEGWCYLFTNGYLLENNPVAALAIGLLREPMQSQVAE